MLLASMFCHCICILHIFLYRASLTRPPLSQAFSRMVHRIACKSYSFDSGAVWPTENQPSVVLPDRERAAARVKTHMHRKSCQKDSQRSLSITFYCLCRSHSMTVFSPLGLVCEYWALGPTHPTGTWFALGHLCLLLHILLHIFISRLTICKACLCVSSGACDLEENTFFWVESLLFA